MGVIDTARRWMRDLVFPPLVITQLDAGPGHTFDAPLRPVDQVISDMLQSGWGARVSRSTALSVPAVLRGRNELCSIATLPLRLYRGLDVERSPLLAQLDLNATNVATLAATVEDLVFESLSWWHVTGRDTDAYPIAVEHVATGRVSLQPPAADGQATTAGGYVAASSAGPKVWLDGNELPARDFIRFDSPNPALLQAGARAIRRAVLLDTLAATYADNPRPLDYFTDSDRDDVEPMDDDEVRDFIAEWQALRKRSSTGWMPKTVQRVDVATPSPVDLQLVELQRQVTLEIANALGVDPEDLGVSTTSRTYFNAQDRAQQRINRTLAPYMRAITDRLSMYDVTRRGYEVRFDLTDYLKADPASQITYWQGLYGMGAISSDEIRNAAGLSGRAPLAASSAASTSSAAPVRRPLAPAPLERFAGDAPSMTFAARGFAGDTADAAPTVDTEGRTISGVAMPYGAVAEKYGVRYRFRPGSLEYGDVSRVKHMQSHAIPVGSALELDDKPDALRVKLGVLGGPEGSPVKLERDQLLHDAAAGLYDGLSVGVDFSLYPEDGDVEYDADTDTYDVLRATLREVSTTPFPAFDDARVTQVAASRGGIMHCPHCGKDHAPGIACAAFARQLEAAAPPQQRSPVSRETGEAPPVPNPADPLDAFGAVFSAWVEREAQRAGAPANGPVLVDPTRTRLTVTEPAPYRFDRRGNLRAGSHDFSSDLVAGMRDGDPAARDRAERWVQDCFASDNIGSLTQTRQDFAITPSNVVNLNYPANRPDLYVDQLDYLYPMYDGTFKGTLDVVTPFVVPKFGTSSGLVADHVTGTEPTPGAFTATAQTITPSAVSGKVEITREAFDQGGNPQMSGLIWRQMVRGWYEALEAYVQAQLVANAASITDITITTAAVDSVLDGLISAAIVPLQYIRGGDRFGRVYTQVDLYKAMAAAKDSTGRRLYPMYGPQNANGTTREGYSAIDAHGKTWLPAWATAATSVNPGSSWMFDPDVVCLWASTPQRIDMQWRVAWVDLGLWGYKAFAVTDFTRTREIIYDPV